MSRDARSGVMRPIWTQPLYLETALRATNPGNVVPHQIDRCVCQIAQAVANANQSGHPELIPQLVRRKLEEHGITDVHVQRATELLEKLAAVAIPFSAELHVERPPP